MENVKLFVATKAFISHKGKVLVVRESLQYVDGVHGGKYDVVGGRLTPGEHFDENIRRETKEETGLEVTIGEPFFVNESWPVVRGEQWQIVRIFFKCTTNSNKVTLSKDHDDFRWIDPKKYKDSNLIENLFPAFGAYLPRKFPGNSNAARL